MNQLEADIFTRIFAEREKERMTYKVGDILILDPLEKYAATLPWCVVETSGLGHQVESFGTANAHRVLCILYKGAKTRVVGLCENRPAERIRLCLLDHPDLSFWASGEYLECFHFPPPPDPEELRLRRFLYI